MTDPTAGPPDAVDRAIGVLIVAVRAQAFAEVREKVDGLPSIMATVPAYSSWHESDPARWVKHPELEGVVFVRRSDILVTLDALQNKDTNTHTTQSGPTASGGAK